MYFVQNEKTNGQYRLVDANELNNNRDRIEIDWNRRKEKRANILHGSLNKYMAENRSRDLSSSSFSEPILEEKNVKHLYLAAETAKINYEHSTLKVELPLAIKCKKKLSKKASQSVRSRLEISADHIIDDMGQSP
ncbi:hypothetical protein BLOT_002960 [Blomia tropicalis]|nr:hypothetical protein BLOT_002960 [Blomia tropicalis]